LTETKYRIAVSLEAESARPILRSIASELVTNLKEHTNSTQYLQYLEFLASIEEGEEVLKLYETLYPYNNQNSQFLINLGCRAYLNGNYEKAQKIFSEASNLLPYNSLPTYLLSSSIFKISQTNENLDKVISYLARENRNNHPIIFPNPFWHNSLPTLCYAYYLRKKEILFQ
jgi:tetratricopeptide (TPR) repeat protein